PGDCCDPHGIRGKLRLGGLARQRVCDAVSPREKPGGGPATVEEFRGIGPGLTTPKHGRDNSGLCGRGGAITVVSQSTKIESLRNRHRAKNTTERKLMAYELPPLPYPKEALEPHIDAQTMEIHHGKHHNAYVTNLNKALAGKGDLEKKPIEELISNMNAVPEDI